MTIKCHYTACSIDLIVFNLQKQIVVVIVVVNVYLGWIDFTHGWMPDGCRRLCRAICAQRQNAHDDTTPGRRQGERDKQEEGRAEDENQTKNN